MFDSDEDDPTPYRCFYTHTYKHAHLQSRIHVRMHMYECMRACMCIHAYAHAHAHAVKYTFWTHKRTHLQMNRLGSKRIAVPGTEIRHDIAHLLAPMLGHHMLCMERGVSISECPCLQAIQRYVEWWGGGKRGGGKCGDREEW